MENEILISSQLGKEIIWEKNIIRIPFDTENERDLKIYSLIKNLQKEISRLKTERTNFDFLSLTNEQAKKSVLKFLKLKKREGNGKIDLFEISSSLKIPAQQVEEIIEKDLIKEDLLREIE